MPYKTVYVPADVFLEHKGRTVYHAYLKDQYEDRRYFWYALDAAGLVTFDVRKLPRPCLAWMSPHALEFHAEVIRRALDTGTLDGLLKQADEQEALLQELVDDGGAPCAG